MHGFTRGLEKRLRALELRLGSILEPETSAETSRRLELVRAASLDLEPADLQEHERAAFSKIRASLPLLLELRDEGALDAYLDDPGPDPHRDGGDEPLWEA